MGPCLPQGNISATCTSSVFRNDRKHKYVAIFHKINSTHQGLISLLQLSFTSSFVQLTCCFLIPMLWWPQETISWFWLMKSHQGGIHSILLLSTEMWMKLLKLCFFIELNVFYRVVPWLTLWCLGKMANNMSMAFLDAFYCRNLFLYFSVLLPTW